MSIAILYICTGKYKIFWKDFCLSCEKNFIPNLKKHYFVFTDNKFIEFEDKNNVTKIYQKDLGWPYNTLMRYDVFLKNKTKWENFNYSFFFNSNLLFNTKITQKDFLPENNKKLVACIHPGFFNKENKKFTYEKRKKSLAYIKIGKYYFAGGINGGHTNYFISAIEKINNNIKQDLDNNIVAVWHDESHWNKYINDNLEIVKILDPGYLYPENFNIPFEKKIIIRDKNRYGGHNFLRSQKESISKKIKRKIISSLKIIYDNIKNFWRSR